MSAQIWIAPWLQGLQGASVLVQPASPKSDSGEGYGAQAQTSSTRPVHLLSSGLRQIFPYSPTSLPGAWLGAAMLVVTHNVAMVYATQGSATTLLTCLVWFGAALCIEDRLADLRPEPTLPGMFLGFALIAFSVWRSHQVFHLDAVIYGLVFLQGLGLALFLVPLSRLRELTASLLILASLAIPIFLPAVLPVDVLSHITARVTQVMLALFFQVSEVAGQEVWLRGRGVRIAGGCSGTDTLAQLVAVGIIFTQAFPLRNRLRRYLMLALILPLAIIVNAGRISLLAYVNSLDWVHRDWWFKFLHESEGSLLFGGLAVFIYGWIYLLVLQSQLRPATQDAA
jgi:exosortase/archaeosortase family protein